MIRRLSPYAANLKKRLVRSPKLYVRDSGVLHTLLNIPDRNTLLGHPIHELLFIQNISGAIFKRKRILLKFP